MKLLFSQRSGKVKFDVAVLAPFGYYMLTRSKKVKDKRSEKDNRRSLVMTEKSGDRGNKRFDSRLYKGGTEGGRRYDRASAIGAGRKVQLCSQSDQLRYLHSVLAGARLHS